MIPKSKTNQTMKTKLTTVLSGASALLLASCATKISNDPKAPTGAPDATLSVDIAQASYYGSATSGGGRLIYQGRSYPISVNAVGGGGLGAQTIHATGKVYHLKSLAAFPGTYTGTHTSLLEPCGDYVSNRRAPAFYERIGYGFRNADFDRGL